MVQKFTTLRPADRCGVFLVKTFHLYKGFNRKVSYTGDFIKVSVRKHKPNNLLPKKTKTKALIVRTKFFLKKLDSSYIWFNYNNCVLLKKRTTPQGSRLFGPIPTNINRKKIGQSFLGTI